MFNAPFGPRRKDHLLPDSETGGKSTAIAPAPIETGKFDGGDQTVWLTLFLNRTADHIITRFDEPLPSCHAPDAEQVTVRSR